ncbi:hypothetical protein VNO77_03242 [Canavalia gladiata]|uniref:Uncharacterized protein n=1 Tax=Canavalia gladiata TaxID=3824 RepID=A0AAN9MUD6_CANGL
MQSFPYALKRRYDLGAKATLSTTSSTLRRYPLAARAGNYYIKVSTGKLTINNLSIPVLGREDAVVNGLFPILSMPTSVLVASIIGLHESQTYAGSEEVSLHVPLRLDLRDKQGILNVGVLFSAATYSVVCSGLPSKDCHSSLASLNPVLLARPVLERE